jgi:hypothetical protein
VDTKIVIKNIDESKLQSPSVRKYSSMPQVGLKTNHF